MRKSEVLPAPLGPSSASAPPACTEKLRPRKTLRPPRTPARSMPSMPIRVVTTFPIIGVGFKVDDGGVRVPPPLVGGGDARLARRGRTSTKLDRYSPNAQGALPPPASGG